MNKPGKLRTVHYATSSHYKRQENSEFVEHCVLTDGTPVKELFEFKFRNVSVKEYLEVDLVHLVRSEVFNAYQKLRVPCIVEHAGLIFEEYQECSYPGGLTKAMWNALRENFIRETSSANRSAIALAVVGYCDGQVIKTFEGRTRGVLAELPRGSREFYWDTVFIPEDPSGISAGKTYAEIVQDDNLGLPYKVKHLSQSTKAMLAFLEYLRGAEVNRLWV